MRIASLNPWSRIGSGWSRSYRFWRRRTFLDKFEHPVEEEPRGILKRGNKSKRGNSEPKRVHFWDENPPILKVLRVQDHHGHVAQVHSSGKEELDGLGDGQEKNWDLDCARSMRKDHRAAEVVLRSGSTEPCELVATWGIGFLGNSNVIGKGKIILKPQGDSTATNGISVFFR